MTAHQELFRERVDGLCPDAVQAHAELEHVVVVLGAGIDHRDAIDNFTQGNTAPVITDLHFVFEQLDFDFCAIAHNKFINRIIDDLFDHHIDSIIGMRSISKTTDIHTRA